VGRVSGFRQGAPAIVEVVLKWLADLTAWTAAKRNGRRMAQMKTLGLIGGTGWVSTVQYYRLLNEEMNRRLGGHEAARCILFSLNFGDVMRAKEGDPEQTKVREMLVDAATRLARAGVDGLMLCANTMHWFADSVGQAVPLPLVHIGDATGTQVLAAGFRKVGLLGTLPTMERDFYRARFDAMGIETLVPDEAGRQFVNRAIYGELVLDRFLPETRSAFLEIIAGLRARGAQGVVLGCTEIPLLITQEDCALPLFDTLTIHAKAGVDFLLG
jgi:aspartate racemase